MNLDPARKLFVVFGATVLTAASAGLLFMLLRWIFGGPTP